LSYYVCIRRFGQPIDAEMVADLLRYRGIRAVVRIADERGSERGVDEELLPYEVCVRQERFEEAASILRVMLSDSD
jgi:hypothetical protein